jgi:CHAD domain-containing protein
MHPDELLRAPTGLAVRAVCLDLLRRALRAETRLADPSDAEALHDFRVALRRLRATLRVFRDALGRSVRKRDRRSVSELQRATGGGRDAQVALAWLEAQRASLQPEHQAGVEWLSRRFAAELGAARGQLDRELRGRFRDVVARLEEQLARPRAEAGNPVPFGEALAGAVDAAARALHERLGGIRCVADHDAMHAARIACKRLRYLVDPVRASGHAAAELARRCKTLQDLLGELNDARVLETALHAALHDSAAERAARVSELLRGGYLERARREAWLTEWPGLIEAAQRVADARDALFARFQQEWLVPDASPLAEPVEAALAALRLQAH